jgi:hypothetical protein
LVNAQVEKLMEKKSKSHFRFPNSPIARRYMLIPELDAFDKEKTKKLAKEHAEAALKKSGQF